MGDAWCSATSGPQAPTALSIAPGCPCETRRPGGQARPRGGDALTGPQCRAAWGRSSHECGGRGRRKVAARGGGQEIPRHGLLRERPTRCGGSRRPWAPTRRNTPASGPTGGRTAPVRPLARWRPASSRSGLLPPCSPRSGTFGYVRPSDDGRSLLRPVLVR